VIEVEQEQVTPSPTFQVEDANNLASAQSAIIQITQDECKSPSANMHKQRKTRMLTHDSMVQFMEIPSYKPLLIPRQAASRQYPLQFLCNFSYSVLDYEAGDLLEYCHLMKHPKYEELWTKSFGTRYSALPQQRKPFIYQERQDATRAQGQQCICTNRMLYCDGKKDKYHARITMGGNLVNYPGDCGIPTPSHSKTDTEQYHLPTSLQVYDS
jgi:hypothetical protein